MGIVYTTYVHSQTQKRFKVFTVKDVTQGRRPQFRLLAKYIHKTVRTDTDRVRCDWLLLLIKY